MKLRLRNWPNNIESAIALISRIFNNIGMAFLIILMLVITVDVILRTALNMPIRGANEIAQFLMILVVFLAVAYTQHKKAHIAVDLLHTRFPKRVQIIVDCFIYFLSLGICSLMVWQAFVYLNKLREMNRTTEVLMVPVAPFELILFVGLAMFGLVLLLDFIHSLQRAVRA